MNKIFSTFQAFSTQLTAFDKKIMEYGTTTNNLPYQQSASVSLHDQGIAITQKVKFILDEIEETKQKLVNLEHTFILESIQPEAKTWKIELLIK